MEPGMAADDVARKPKTATPLLSVQGSYARLEGKFEIADSVVVQCEIGGEMVVDGELLIGKEGTVRAEVRSVDAVIEGVFEGDLTASGKVEIRTTGRVIGNLKTNSLVIEPGGFFNGNVQQLEETAPAVAEADPVETKVVHMAPAVAESPADDEAEGEETKGSEPVRAKPDSPVPAYPSGARAQARKASAV